MAPSPGMYQRITEWFGLGGTLKLFHGQGPAWGWGCRRVRKAPSSELEEGCHQLPIWRAELSTGCFPHCWRHMAAASLFPWDGAGGGWMLRHSEVPSPFPHPLRWDVGMSVGPGLPAWAGRLGMGSPWLPVQHRHPPRSLRPPTRHPRTPSPCRGAHLGVSLRGETGTGLRNNPL